MMKSVEIAFLVGLTVVTISALASICQRRNNSLPVGRSKSRPVWGARVGACGPQIANTFQGALAVRPISGLLFLFRCEACAALVEAVAFTVHFQNVHVVS